MPKYFVLTENEVSFEYDDYAEALECYKEEVENERRLTNGLDITLVEVLEEFEHLKEDS